MYMSPTFFFDIGMRSLKRNPFFLLTRLSLEEGESDFRILDRCEGLVVTLGPNTSFFDRPGRSVCRRPGTKTTPRHSSHPLPVRSRIMNEFSIFIQLLCGGGDVQVNRITTLNEQREILLTAGEGNVVEKIDLTGLARDGVPPLLFLQPAYLCSSANAVIQSVPCDASIMSWARAPYAYMARAAPSSATPAILCLSGRTMVWCERLQPGESRDFALGNVIATTTNIVSTLRPTSKCHPDDHSSALLRQDAPCCEETISPSGNDERKHFFCRIREFVAALKILFELMRAREGFFVCELTNCSDQPAYVFIQLNKNGFYGGSGLVGLVIRFVSAFFRISHLSIGH